MENHGLRVECRFEGERSHFMKEAREQVDFAAHLTDGTIYRTDAKRAKQLQTRSESIGAEVLTAMARWEELEKKKG